MSIVNDMKNLAAALGKKYSPPPVRSMFFPLLFSRKQPHDCGFMALLLEDGSAGMSYVDIPAEYSETYSGEDPREYPGRSVLDLASRFGSTNPVVHAVGMAAVNALCQHAIQKEKLFLKEAEDSFGNLNLEKGDILGMVGFFRPIMEEVKKKRVGLVIVEQDSSLVLQHPHLPLTNRKEKLKRCNKILITSVTILNSTLDELLPFCQNAHHISVVGPTAGYLPDPLFRRGIDSVGGRFIHDGEMLLDRLVRRVPWGDATRKMLFEKKDYTSPLGADASEC